MFLKVTNLTKRFGSATVVDQVSFELTEKSFTSILGPSGCGKSTTLRCIAGLEVPDEGEIVMGETKLFSAKDHVSIPPNRRGMAMVFQSYAIWPHMTVFENVAFPLKVRKKPSSEIKERVGKVLELVQLPGLENRPATQLSGGQQQRVALARSIIMEPKLLLLDEPLSNLDAKLREEMRLELRDLQKNLGITTLYVTHDQAEAFSLSDDIKIMIDGRLLEEGPPHKLYLSPGNDKIAEFLGCKNRIPVKVKEYDNKNGLATVETSLGDIVSYVDKNHKEGDKFNLYIRPSNITLYQSKPANVVNLFKGKIKYMTYLGSDHIEYHVTLGDQEFRAKGALFLGVDFSKDVFVVIDPRGNVCV